MEFDANMVTKDGKKMMYLIAIDVKQDCKDYDKIWTELKRRMKAVSVPIINVDWPLYDDNGKAYDFNGNLFYAQTFEIGMGFATGIMKVHEIRSNLEFCNFFNGDSYKKDTKKYNAENLIEITKKILKKYHPNEIW